MESNTSAAVDKTGKTSGSSGDDSGDIDTQQSHEQYQSVGMDEEVPATVPATSAPTTNPLLLTRRLCPAPSVQQCISTPNNRATVAPGTTVLAKSPDVSTMTDSSDYDVDDDGDMVHMLAVPAAGV